MIRNSEITYEIVLEVARMLETNGIVCTEIFDGDNLDFIEVIDKN
jgi:hypothetical protein